MVCDRLCRVSFCLHALTCGVMLMCASAVEAMPHRPSYEQQSKQEAPAVKREITIDMRDGITTKADFWQDKELVGRTMPVILIRTPYGRVYEEHVATFWVQIGYHVVVQAVRGRDGSEGMWYPWENELKDGYDTIDWIAKQDWCNGRVGMVGGSYLGHVQILAAAAAHPALKCIMPLSPGSDGFSDVPFSGGVPTLGLFGWLYSCRGPMLDPNTRYPASANTRNLLHLPLSAVDEKWAGEQLRIWNHWMSVETLADMPGIGLGIWERLARAEHKVPAFHIGGVWDIESMATRRNWEQFSKYGGEHQYFIFGPWPHEPNQSSRYADMEYGEHAVVELEKMRHRWLGYWLHDDKQALENFPRVQVFATGANRWLHLDQWPAGDASPVTFHITKPTRRASGKFAEALSIEPADQPVQWDWTYNPVKTPGLSRDILFARTTRLWFRNSDSDAIVLATRPFETSTLLTGPVELEVALESSARDTDLFALLVEIARDGTVRALHRHSPLRVRFREGYDKAIPMEPDTVHSVSWMLGDFAHVFEAGSRLGLAIRSDWFPEHARNLGTMEPNATATEPVIQRNRIHAGGEHVSVLRLHQVPLSRLQNDDDAGESGDRSR